MSGWTNIDGGATAARGYRAAGVHAGIKKSAPDLALLVSDRDAGVAGVFTRNRVQGATVRLCRERLHRGRARAVVINSGNANACTGPRGDADARRMAALAAELLAVEEESVFVCSTGTIGVPLPMPAVESGIRTAVETLAPAGGADAARAIMTTDTVAKQVAVEIEAGGGTVRIGGMAKGAGMIEPDMATMLAFLTTDAAVAPTALQESLATAVGKSFNRISVDGDQSCNDTVLMLANGASETAALDAQHPDWPLFLDAVEHVARELAHAIVRDGEGATKFVTLTVRGAASTADARQAARAVANSLLVKTAWYGEDPNWGRIIDAVGYSGAELRQDAIDIAYDNLAIVRGGCAVPGYDPAPFRAILARDAFTVTVDLHAGTAADTVYTCDCSVDYVKINSEYTT